MNLISDPWLPIITRDGAATIRPAEIVREDVLALNFPRADFNGAVSEFLIGLLATLAPPRDEAAWLRQWQNRPSMADLDAAFAPAVDAFDLTRVLQTPIDGTPVPIEQLIPSSEGTSTTDNGLDVMGRNDRIIALSPAMAAAALITLQTHAPEGGSAKPDGASKREGYYASIRGSGPLTTLVAIGTDLWGSIWPNVACDVPTAEFPWMRADDADITPDNAPPQTVYWAMPRRVHLIVEPSNGDRCSLSGEASEMLVRSYVALAGGRRFVGWAHPLSPHRKTSVGVMPVRGSTERIGMRHWRGLVQSSADGKRIPARCVSHYRAHRWVAGSARLIAHGYQPQQAALIGWQSGSMPLLVGDAETTAELERMAEQLALSVDTAEFALTRAIGECERSTRGIRDLLWALLEPAFLATLRAVPAAMVSDDDDPTQALRRAWLGTLTRVTLQIFDEVCPLDRHPERVVTARHELGRKLRGKKLKAQLQIGSELEAAAA